MYTSVYTCTYVNIISKGASARVASYGVSFILKIYVWYRDENLVLHETLFGKYQSL